MKRSFWVATGVITVAVIAATYYYTRDVAAEAPAFATAEVSRGDVISTVEATGTLEAVTTVQVGSQVSGTISALHADFNSEVRKGQIIAELDSSLFQTQVEQARATVVRLQADVDRAKVQAADADIKLKRAQELFDRQLIPKTDLETAESTARSAEAAVKGAEAQVVQAQASLNQAQVNLSHTIIRAPIDGVVIARNVDVGQTVASSLQAPTLFIIARDLAEMQVNASVDESDIGEIAPKAERQIPRGCLSERDVHRQGHAGAAAAGRAAERRELRHGHRRAQPGTEAEAGDDGGRHHRNRSGRRCAEGAERGIAIHTDGGSSGTRPAHGQPAAGSKPGDDKRNSGLGARAGQANTRAGAGRNQRWQRHGHPRRRSHAGRARRHRNGNAPAPAATTAPATSPLLPFGRRGGGGNRGGAR